MSPHSKEAQKCFCGSSNCRGYLGGENRVSIRAAGGKMKKERSRKKDSVSSAPPRLQNPSGTEPSTARTTHVPRMGLNPSRDGDSSSTSPFHGGISSTSELSLSWLSSGRVLSSCHCSFGRRFLMASGFRLFPGCVIKGWIADLAGLFQLQWFYFTRPLKICVFYHKFPIDLKIWVAVHDF